MELFELRYFLAAAKHSNVQKAADASHVSKASISKAIARLEDELGCKLFSRHSKGITLSEAGIILQRRASQMLQLESTARVEVTGHESAILLKMVGSESVLSYLADDVINQIKQRFPQLVTELEAVNDAEAIKRVETGDAHLALITSPPPKWSQRTRIATTEFQTIAAKKHKIFRQTAPVPIEKVLQHAFIAPKASILGQVGIHGSSDGWRDDQFKRNVVTFADSLHIIIKAVEAGTVLGYLPDYVVKQMDAKVIDISGCPYSCKQNIYLIGRDITEISWLNQSLNLRK